MSKYCPLLKTKVTYMECLECEEKICKNQTSKDEVNGKVKQDINPPYGNKHP